MSIELQHGLASVTKDEFFSAIVNVHLRQRDGVEARAMFDSFTGEFPELLAGVDMVRVVAEGEGLNPGEVLAMSHTAMLVLFGLKEIIDMRKLNTMLDAQ